MKICTLMVALVASPPSEYEALLAPWSGSESPGGFIGVVRADGDDLEIPFGMASLEDARPMTARTELYAASVAKTFTATAAVHAVESGRLALDASIAPLFPELPPGYGAVTLGQLIHHRSGVVDMYDMAVACDLPASVFGSNDAVVELLTRLPGPSFAPGERFLYSNSGYVLLAEAIARGTGSSLPEYARKHVFEPAGMDDAHYLDGAGRGERAISYSRSARGWAPREVRTGTIGPGGLFLSGRDLMQFVRSERTSRTPAAAGPGPHHPRLGRYGAGWMHQTLGRHRVVRHYGGAFGFGADILRLPDDGLDIVVLVNTDAIDVTDLAESVARIALGDGFRPGAEVDGVTLTAPQRQRFGRFWRETESGRLWAVIDRQDHFQVVSLGDLNLAMVPVTADRLEAVEGHVPFAVQIENERLIVHHDDGSTTALEAVPFPTRGRTDAAAVAGRYVNERLGATIELEALPDGMIRLVQHDPLLELTPFIPLSRDSLMCDRGAQIDLRRDGRGRITGLVMSANRAWGLEFERSDGS